MRATHHVAAHRGRVLAAATAEHVMADGQGRPTVLRFVAHDGIARACALAVASLEASGCLSLDVVVDASGGITIAGVDRHVVATMHASQGAGVDVAAAWLAALDGRTPPGATSLPAGTSHVVVAFPQEWDRDRRSPWLREHRVDVPWDDPELLDAIIAGAIAADAATADHGA